MGSTAPGHWVWDRDRVRVRDRVLLSRRQGELETMTQYWQGKDWQRYHGCKLATRKRVSGENMNKLIMHFVFDYVREMKGKKFVDVQDPSEMVRSMGQGEETVSLGLCMLERIKSLSIPFP